MDYTCEMRYSLDLAKISMYEYKDLLLKKALLPGRIILLENIEERFNAILNLGVHNVLDLKKALATSTKLKFFSENTNISEEYLTILRREIGSLEQKSVEMKSFPDIDNNLVEIFESQKLITSKDYFENCHLEDDNERRIDMLYCLCDLVRINGVGVAAARAFYEAGYRSAMDVANAKAEDMLVRVNAVNEVKQYYKARLGAKDMQFCIDFAILLTRFESDK